MLPLSFLIGVGPQMEALEKFSDISPIGNIDSILGSVDSMVSTIGSMIQVSLGNIIGKICYYITAAVCLIVRVAYSVFSIFSGITKVSINGDYQYLTNFFFENDIVSGVYWGMVMIGIVLVFAFAIVAVIRKIFDLYDKQQHSIGQILSGTFKAIFVMLCLTFFMSSAMSLTNELVRRVNYVFDENKTLLENNEIVFTDEQFATMARIFNTIGNYSLNPSYNQRFNLNACYNEIRPDLLILQQQGVFDIVYTDTSDSRSDKIEGPCWQVALEELAMAANPSELAMDAYYDQASEALLYIMDELRNDANFKPIESFSRKRVSTQAISLDCVVFLSGTMNAAHNKTYNENPSMDDAVRGPFLHEDKSIYDLDEVSSVFNVQLGGISYIVIWFTSFFVLQSLMRTILACASRLINIVGLYLIAPPVAAAIPLDDGQKFKEWITSMVIQMLGIFGNIIPMRLVLLFVPMILDSRFVLSSSILINSIGKVLLIVGILKGVDRFGGILTGILANSAGQAAIRASDLNDDADSMFDKYIGQHVPGMRNFASPAYAQKMQQMKKDKADGAKNGGDGGGQGGSASGFGGSRGSALPGKSPQYPSMNASTMGGMGGFGGSRGGFGGNQGGFGGNQGGFGGNQGGFGGNQGGFGGSQGGLGSFGLPSMAPKADSMNASNQGNSSGGDQGGFGGDQGGFGGDQGGFGGDMGAFGLPSMAPQADSMNASNQGDSSGGDQGDFGFSSYGGAFDINSGASINPFAGGNQGDFGFSSYGGAYDPVTNAPVDAMVQPQDLGGGNFNMGNIGNMGSFSGQGSGNASSQGNATQKPQQPMPAKKIAPPSTYTNPSRGIPHGKKN